MNSFFLKLVSCRINRRKGNGYKAFFIFIMFFYTVLSVHSQTPDAKDKINKNNLSIKPNSRDFNVDLRDNSFKQVKKQKNQMMLKKMQHVRQKKFTKKNFDQNRRQEMMHRRKQMIQTRRNTRR